MSPSGGAATSSPSAYSSTTSAGTGRPASDERQRAQCRIPGPGAARPSRAARTCRRAPCRGHHHGERGHRERTSRAAAGRPRERARAARRRPARSRRRRPAPSAAPAAGSRQPTSSPRCRAADEQQDREDPRQQRDDDDAEEAQHVGQRDGARRRLPRRDEEDRDDRADPGQEAARSPSAARAVAGRRAARGRGGGGVVRRLGDAERLPHLGGQPPAAPPAGPRHVAALAAAGTLGEQAVRTSASSIAVVGGLVEAGQRGDLRGPGVRSAHEPGQHAGLALGQREESGQAHARAVPLALVAQPQRGLRARRRTSCVVRREDRAAGRATGSRERLPVAGGRRRRPRHAAGRRRARRRSRNRRGAALARRGTSSRRSCPVPAPARASRAPRAPRAAAARASAAPVTAAARARGRTARAPSGSTPCPCRARRGCRPAAAPPSRPRRRAARAPCRPRQPAAPARRRRRPRRRTARRARSR